jgi:16S rRNA (guanine527-N7)-methyltransferase
MLTPEAIRTLLEPYSIDNKVVVDLEQLSSQLAVYLELILKWNARTNLTAVREPEEIVRRHFGESLFAGLHLGQCAALLDFGSGAGLPGIPIQLLRPEVHVTLAESQGKKAAFLREAIRALGLGTEVWAGRVEAMPPERRFDGVAMRAVDRMEQATQAAALRARSRMLLLTTAAAVYRLNLPGFREEQRLPLPASEQGLLVVLGRE